MRTRTHETITGHRIEFEPPGAKVARFLEQVQELVADEKASENDVVALVYSSENPILEQSAIGAAITKETLANPIYRVLKDLVERKRIAARRIDVAKLAAGYTLTVGEAADELDVHESAIRQAIASGRLASWVKGGKHFLHPKWLRQYAATLDPKTKRLAHRAAG